MADAPADAATVPVTWPVSLLPVLLGLWQAALPFGLRAGRHDVGVRAVTSDDPASVWYPADCGRRPADPARPCRDAPADSSRFPLVILSPGGNRAVDTALVEYFASHGYAAVVGGGAGMSRAHQLPFVDATRVATVDAQPALGLVRLDLGDRRIIVDAPPGVRGDRIRLRAAVLHALLDGALRVSPPALDDAGRRLRAAGLVVRFGS